MLNINELTNETQLTQEEGYELTKFYVNYFWRTNKFYSLKNQYDEEDIVSIIYIKFMEHNHFAKYNPNITSKKYHIMNGVRTSMIDLLRKYREVVYLDKENEEGSTLMETIESPQNIEVEAISSFKRDDILNALPESTNSKITGFSPLLKREVNISYRILALHLEAGYKASDLAKFYKNPTSGENVSEGSISRYIREMREYVLDNIVVA